MGQRTHSLTGPIPQTSWQASRFHENFRSCCYFARLSDRKQQQNQNIIFRMLLARVTAANKAIVNDIAASIFCSYSLRRSSGAFTSHRAFCWSRRDVSSIWIALAAQAMQDTVEATTPTPVSTSLGCMSQQIILTFHCYHIFRWNFQTGFG